MVPTRAALVLLAAVACDDDVEPLPGGSANYSASLGDDPDFSQPHGRILVQTWLDYGDIQLSGAFADGPPPSPHTESERSGSCRLMTYTPTTCTPACADTELCVDAECVGWPERQDRGDLEWTWPDGQQTVSPDGTLGYWATGSATQAGEVEIEVDGLVLTSPTIDVAEADGDWARAISDRGSDDAVLRWTNPILDARVRLHMTDCVGSHGGLAEAEIECEGPDTGELAIPDAYLDILDAGDWSHGECGSHLFARYHAAAPVDDTTIRLETWGEAGLFYRPDW